MGSTTTYCEREPLLPQTTTGTRRGRTRAVLYPIKFLHQTTTTVVCSPGIGICILSISTSNHNLGSIKYRIPVIYIGVPLKKSFPSCRRSSLNVVFFQTQTDKCIKKIPIGEAFRVWRVQFTPVIQGLAILLVRHAQNTRNPEGCIDLRTRLICTCMFSLEAQ